MENYAFHYNGQDASFLNKNNGAKYHLQKGNYEYFAFKSYIPMRFNATQEEHNDRILVFNFKDGNIYASREVATLVIKFIRNQYSTVYDKVFMVIPASTEQKNTTRFAHLANMVCNNTGIQNGMDGISIVRDRSANKGLVGINKIQNLNFDSSYFKGKHVILFDDVTTSGGSFKQIADVLIRKGAIKVTGIFLAKTIHK